MKGLHYILLLFLFFSTNLAFSQSKKQKKADRYFNDLAYAKAVLIYEELMLENQGNTHVIKHLADSYRLMLKWEHAEYWYGNLIDTGEAEAIDYYYYSQALRANKKYELANKFMAEYAKRNELDSRGKRKLAGKKKLHELLTGSARIKVKNLEINSKEADFGSAYYEDGKMIFSSSRTGASEGLQYTFAWNGRPFLDLYVADINANGKLSNPRIFAPELNSKYHEGPVIFTKSRNVIYFTRNNYFKKKVGKSKKDINNLKIYKAVRIGDTWGQISSLHFNSDEYSCGHPTLSPDGNRLYFVSDMPLNNRGGTDIYYCDKAGIGWGKPINLGDSINTEGNEMFPSMHEDGTLYFSSDGHFGLGGLDIFFTQPDSTGSYNNKPKNIASPINSSKDDFAFVMATDKRSGYFSSNRENGVGDDDIYYFRFDTTLVSTPDEVVASNPIEELITGTTLETEPTDGSVPMEVGEKVVLKNVYYDHDKWFIRPDAEEELDKLIAFMQKYPSTKIELSSHTDSRASDKYNMELSRKRAVSAVMYLVVNGKIDPDRLVAKGYGETQLTNNCSNGVECSEEEHQANRRTEITLLEK